MSIQLARKGDGIHRIQAFVCVTDTTTKSITSASLLLFYFDVVENVRRSGKKGCSSFPFLFFCKFLFKSLKKSFDVEGFREMSFNSFKRNTRRSTAVRRSFVVGDR